MKQWQFMTIWKTTKFEAGLPLVPYIEDCANNYAHALSTGCCPHTANQNIEITEI